MASSSFSTHLETVDTLAVAGIEQGNAEGFIHRLRSPTDGVVSPTSMKIGTIPGKGRLAKELLARKTLQGAFIHVALDQEGRVRPRNLISKPYVPSKLSRASKTQVQEDVSDYSPVMTTRLMGPPALTAMEGRPSFSRGSRTDMSRLVVDTSNSVAVVGDFDSLDGLQARTPPLPRASSAWSSECSEYLSDEDGNSSDASTAMSRSPAMSITSQRSVASASGGAVSQSTTVPAGSPDDLSSRSGSSADRAKAIIAKFKKLAFEEAVGGSKTAVSKTATTTATSTTPKAEGTPSASTTPVADDISKSPTTSAELSRHFSAESSPSV